MKSNDVTKILKEQKTFLTKTYFVKKIGIFGSHARNEETGESDIDLLVEFSRPVGFEFLDLKDYLEKVLNKPVDLVTVNALKPSMREAVLGEVQYP
jgi:predicted nucleotidyltransferase